MEGRIEEMREKLGDIVDEDDEVLITLDLFKIWPVTGGPPLLYDVEECLIGLVEAEHGSTTEERQELFEQAAEPSCPLLALHGYNEGYPFSWDLLSLAECGGVGGDAEFTATDWVWDRLCDRAGDLGLVVEDDKVIRIGRNRVTGEAAAIFRSISDTMWPVFECGKTERFPVTPRFVADDVLTHEHRRCLDGEV